MQIQSKVNNLVIDANETTSVVVKMGQGSFAHYVGSHAESAEPAVKAVKKKSAKETPADTAVQTL